MAESSKPKRRIRNPESFRERALKAKEAPKQAKEAGRFRKTLSPIFRPIGKALRPMVNWKPVRILGKIIFPAYFRNSWRELKQVTWPNWQQSRQLTFAVLVFAVIFGAAIAVVDFGLDKVFRNVLLK